jgi:hypothetical protein
VNNLFRTEFLRHSILALGCTGLHFAILAYVSSLGALIHTMPFFTMWTLTLMVFGGGFGLFQMALHKRGNDWLYLLHRPLSLNQIFVPLALAGSAVCLFVALVPPLLMLIVMEGNPLNGVETRQYLLLPFIAVATLSPYFCSWFALLGSSRLSFLAYSVPAAMIIYWTEPPHPALTAGVLLWSIGLARTAFKPDLSRIPQRPTTWLLTELPIQYGCLWVVVLLLAFSAEMQAMIAGVDSVRDPARGTDLYIERLPAPDLLEFALKDSTHPEAQFLLQQVPLSEFAAVGDPDFFPGDDTARLPLAYRHLRLSDAERNVSWIFDHGAMLYAGYDSDSAAFHGWLGPDGFHTDAPPDLRFKEVPWAEANEFLVGAHAIYQIDWEGLRVQKRYDNGSADRFTRSLSISENVATLLSENRLYLFRTADLRNIDVPLQPSAVLDTTANTEPEYRRFLVMELIDGYLVAALTNLTPTRLASDFAMFGKARLEVYRTREGGANEVVASKALPSTFGPVNIYKDFVAAPGMRLLTDMVWGLALGKSAERTWPLLFISFPSYVWLLAAAVSAASAGLTTWLLRKAALPRGARIFWIAGNAFTGLAGLVSLLLGYYLFRTDGLRAGSAP